MYRIGVDIGGTFTDLAASDSAGRLYVAKSVSTPADPSAGLIDGLVLLAEAIGTTRERLLAETTQIIHGTTVATNSLLERKGARVGILTTEGHRDILEMREGLKDDRYNVRMPPPAPLVPRRLIAGVRERARFDGSIETALDEWSLGAAIDMLARARVESVAVCYLHSYRNPAHEKVTARALASRMPDAYVSLSSSVLPQIKEYERFWTTTVNAYVGPVLGRYLTALDARLRKAGYRGELLVLQSHGGVASVDESVRLAVGAVLSGPAGGVAGGQACSELLSARSLITFDMGGTSTDIALLRNGQTELTGQKRVGDARIAVPSLDIHTLGAGGGSIARTHTGGILRVGPESAGSTPGPACYGRGGVEPTVTDANLVLGYLDPAKFLGGRMRLDHGAAGKAVDRVARGLGVDRIVAAEGVHRVVNTNMAEGIRIVSVRRGVDPRGFTLLAFGGAAGLHVSEVARMLEIKRVVVPTVAPVLSAWGMLGTDLRYEIVRSHVGDAARLGAARLRRYFREMEAEGRRRLGDFDGRIEVRRSLDMRYGEQIFEITVDLGELDPDSSDLMDRIVDRFHRRHDDLYAFSAPGQEVVIVNIRVAVVGVLAGRLPQGASEADRKRSQKRAGPARPTGSRRVYLGAWQEVPVFDMFTLAPGQRLAGPAMVESDMTTVLIRDGDRLTVTPHGWLDIRLT
jgi:N-methylhydantoinase A